MSSPNSDPVMSATPGRVAECVRTPYDLTVVTCPLCVSTVEPLGKAWKCNGEPVHYFNVYRVCGECGYSTMYIGHAPGCTQLDDSGDPDA